MHRSARICQLASRRSGVSRVPMSPQRGPFPRAGAAAPPPCAARPAGRRGRPGAPAAPGNRGHRRSPISVKERSTRRSTPPPAPRAGGALGVDVIRRGRWGTGPVQREAPEVPGRQITAHPRHDLCRRRPQPKGFGTPLPRVVTPRPPREGIRPRTVVMAPRPGWVGRHLGPPRCRRSVWSPSRVVGAPFR